MALREEEEEEKREESPPEASETVLVNNATPFTLRGGWETARKSRKQERVTHSQQDSPNLKLRTETSQSPPVRSTPAPAQTSERQPITTTHSGSDFGTSTNHHNSTVCDNQSQPSSKAPTTGERATRDSSDRK
ncbi:hypothetical protein AAFF_G00221990 [Aldrovandia affinis]|uniref:Uncharacterized protein n=1 Tax=Aldrovandia affinis TaxID=143900 RepID=A0AAD7W586_9TELE|nr:hypothetical protein AAFF_G00221990 [Aldrovandia affinis]